MSPPAEVLHGDCGKVLAGPRHAGAYALVVADPPYNTGQKYADYVDAVGRDEYLAFTRRWLAAAGRALAPGGALWVVLPEEWASRADVIAQDEFGFHLRRHLIWAFTFGQAARANFTRSHTHLLYLTKGRTGWHFDEAAVRVPSARQLVYADKRANAAGKQPDDVWMLLAGQMEPHLTPDRAAWLESRVAGTFKARRAVSPNQIPLPIYDRIVRACTKPGDRVLDLFSGTAGLGEVCLRLGRGYVGVDVSSRCVEFGRERLEQVRRELVR